MTILVALVKGNLEHRFEKLGIDILDRVQFQQWLYQIGVAQGWVDVYQCKR